MRSSSPVKSEMAMMSDRGRRPQRRQPHRLGLGGVGEVGDPLGGPRHPLCHPAEGLIEGGAAK